MTKHKEVEGIFRKTRIILFSIVVVLMPVNQLEVSAEADLVKGSPQEFNDNNILENEINVDSQEPEISTDNNDSEDVVDKNHHKEVETILVEEQNADNLKDSTKPSDDDLGEKEKDSSVDNTDVLHKATETVKKQSESSQVQAFKFKTTSAEQSDVLKRPMYDDRVIDLKLKLNRLGFTSFKDPNNYFGPKTEEGVRALQAYYGLPETGEADSATLDKIEDVLKSPFQRGKRNAESITIKQQLVILGYANFKNPNDLYGVQTEVAVKAFQRDNGLPVSGIAEATTRALLAEQANSPLRRGMYREDVVQLKQNLNKLGFTNFKNPNTFFGGQTEQGLRAFQDYYGLTPTGVADQETLKQIHEALNSPFQRGKRHEESITIKEQLVILGYADFKNPTEYYGIQTEVAVKAFQRDNGLPVSGIAEATTRALIAEQATGSLRRGMYREDAVQLKQNLNKLGFTNFKNPNTFFGVQTERGLKAFQDYYDLPSTGIADQETLDKINKVLNSPFQRGKRHEDSITIKQQLTLLGYANFKNPTTLYGVETEAAVKAFQRDNDLPVSGIAEATTRALLAEHVSTPLKKGMYRRDVVQLKYNLNKLGFTNFKNPNTYFGVQTEQGLKALQDYYGLTPTGVADQKTLKQINEVLNSPLQRGNSHSEAVIVKQNLVKIGYANFRNPNNLYGKETEKAVRNFQRDFGLPISGIAEPHTVKKIEEVLANTLQIGKRHPDVIKIKQHLNRLGLTSFKNPNDYFGKQTEAGIKKFQAQYGLPVTGIADKRTIHTLENAFIKIFIDPGHGGHDPGALGYGLREKDIVLDIARELKKELNKYAGVEVKLSRTSDRFISLSERTKMSNDWGAHYFVSLHLNAGGGRGFESYIYNGSVSQETRNRQKDIHNHLANWLSSNNGIRDRGMKRANFHVLRESNMPAILLEYMFIDNRTENNLLKNKNYCKTLGKVTAEAIAKSFGLKKK